MTEKQERLLIARVKDHEERLKRVEEVLRLSSAMAQGEKGGTTAQAETLGKETLSPAQSIKAEASQ